MKEFRVAVWLMLISVGAFAATVPPVILTPVESTVFNITQSGDLWFFNGESPTNYNTSIIINAGGPTQGTFTWSIVSNSAAIHLNNASNTALTSVQQNNPNLLALSAGGSVGPLDVGVNLNYNGSDVGIYNFSVFVPHSVQLLLLQNLANGNFFNPDAGFQTVANYQILDQFGTPIPSALAANEAFGQRTNSPVYPDNNWPSPAPTGFTTSANLPSFMQDVWSATNGLVPPLLSPLSESPQTPPTSAEVFNIFQTYNAGSTLSGSGVTFNSQTLHYYLDHAVPVSTP